MPQPGSIDKGYVEIDAAGKLKPCHCEQAAKMIPLIPVSARRGVAQQIKIEMIAGGNHTIMQYATRPTVRKTVSIRSIEPSSTQEE